MAIVTKRRKNVYMRNRGNCNGPLDTFLHDTVNFGTSSTVSLFVISDDKSQTRRDTRPSIMINPLAKRDETSAALAVAEATVGQKVRHHEL